MFKFLKERLKSAISRFSKDVEESAETKEEEREVKKPLKTQKKEAKKGKRTGKKAGKGQKLPAQKPEKKSPKRKAAEEEQEKAAEEAEQETAEEPQEKKGFFGKLKDRFLKKEEPEEKEEDKERSEKKEKKKREEKQKRAAEEAEQETAEEAEEKEKQWGEGKLEEKEEEEPETEEKQEEEAEEPIKKGFFQRIKDVITTKTLSESKFEELFWDLEVALLENNVAVEVIGKIKEDLKKEIVDVPIPRGAVEDRIVQALHTSISSLFDAPKIDILRSAGRKKPYVIVFIGINGSGKTTSIAKVAHYILKNKKKCVIAAADTFRAAAIQQLEEHGSRLGVKVIRHDYGADPAAVTFDAIRYAESKGVDFVLIDTAGRQHSNANLMDEMKKIVRVSKPDLKIFVGESITGNDCVEQAKEFNAAVEIDGIILTKADVDEKGGAAVSVSYVTQKPIIFIGMGQGYDDLKAFDKEEIMKNIGLGD